jgi:hypothetical protein
MNHDDMNALTADTTNKSEKIRRLFEAGVSASAISTYLGIRYQQTYNVLKRSGQVGKADPPAVGSEVETASFIVDLQDDGLIRLPADVLDAHGFSAGDRLVCRSTADGLTIMSRDRAVAYLRDVVRNRASDDLALFDALLSPRRSGESDRPD